MPELPEVETIARGLARELIDAEVLAVELAYPPIVRTDQATFLARMPGRRFVSVRRRGKLLLLDLDDGSILAVHLRMTGRLFLPPSTLGREDELCEFHRPWQDKHTHARLLLSDGRFLVYHDVRKFGGLALFETAAELNAWPFMAGLGPEPLEIPEAVFVERFRRSRGRIKSLLLDQKRIAGIGNIYADESLFRAGILPDAQADTLSKKRLAALHGHVQDVLQEAIAACGSSIRDYRDADGDAGSFQNKFQVYGRAGGACLRCKAVLAKATVAGRTSVYCPICQKR